MALVTTDDRGAVRVITYANPPIGTMTGAGSSEMFDAMTAGARDGAVRVIVITGKWNCSRRESKRLRKLGL